MHDHNTRKNRGHRLSMRQATKPVIPPAVRRAEIMRRLQVTRRVRITHRPRLTRPVRVTHPLPVTRRCPVATAGSTRGGLRAGSPAGSTAGETPTTGALRTIAVETLAGTGVAIPASIAA